VSTPDAGAMSANDWSTLLDADDLETILDIAANGQAGRVAPYELRALVETYRDRASITSTVEKLREALTEAKVALRLAREVTADKLEPGDVSIFTHPLEIVRAALSSIPPSSAEIPRNSELEKLREALAESLSALNVCREQLELYEQDASGEHYNSPSLNVAIKDAEAALSSIPAPSTEAETK
jgi:hypothetical protein